MSDDPIREVEHRARLMRSVGRSADALALVDDALVVEPADHGLLDLRCDLLTDLDRYAEALETANVRLALDPDDAVAHADAAHALLALPERNSQALTAARRAIALDPDWAFGWLQVVRAQLALKRRRDARRSVDEMIARFPRSQSTAIAAAIAAIDKPVDPSWYVYLLLFLTCLIYPWAVYELFHFVSRRRRLATADRLLRECLTDAPESAALLSLLGRVADARGRLKSGLDLSVQSGRQDPTFATPERVHQRGRRILLCVAAVAMGIWWVTLTVVFTQGIRPGIIATSTGIVMSLVATAVVITGSALARSWAIADVPPVLRRRLDVTALRVLALCATATALTAVLANDEQNKDYLIPYYVITGFATAAGLLLLVAVGWLRLGQDRR